MQTLSLAFLSLSTYVMAQYGAPDPSPTSTAAAAVPSAPADTPGHMNIDVAYQQQFIFHPNNITAPNGTLVTFWIPNNGLAHSVTQSSFANPCTYLAATGNSSAGFDSGLQTAKTFTIQITDEKKPIWFHCKQVSHCGLGMVGSINAPASGNNTFEMFLAAAKQIGGSEVTENDQGPVTGGVNGVATAPPASGTGGSSNNAALVGSYSPALVLLAGTLLVAAL